MTRHLAQLNVGVIRAPLDSPALAGFVARLAEVNAAADAAPGFVWRLKDEDGPGSTGYRMLDDDMLLVNLSVWEDLDSLRRFVVADPGHRDALAERRQWFVRAVEPMTACWPVEPGHRPTLGEAEAMLLRLRVQGPAEDLFPFTYRG